MENSVNSLDVRLKPDATYTMLRFGRRDNPHALVVDMSGVKMGDRLVQIGCANGARLGAIAAKVGLSGRAAAVVPDQESAARAQKGAADAGVLLEVEITPPQRFQSDRDAFDLAIVDDTAGLFGAMLPEHRQLLITNLARALRPGGRVMVISAAPRAGLSALLSRRASEPPVDAVPIVEGNGFRLVRKLAEREGLIFVEGIKPKS